MLELVIDKNKYSDYGLETYKGFYADIFLRFHGNEMGDFKDIENLYYSSDILYEFLCDYTDDAEEVHFVFRNFDLNRIFSIKTADDYKWYLIILVITRYLRKSPNRMIEFERIKE